MIVDVKPEEALSGSGLRPPENQHLRLTSGTWNLRASLAALGEDPVLYLGTHMVANNRL